MLSFILCLNKNIFLFKHKIKDSINIEDNVTTSLLCYCGGRWGRSPPIKDNSFYVWILPSYLKIPQYNYNTFYYVHNDHLCDVYDNQYHQ